jgi:hypothetical protein
MSAGGAETTIVACAIIVAGTYGYRKLTEPASSAGKLASIPTFAIGYTFAFFVIALLGAAAPQLGAALALLLATGMVLTSGGALFKDIAAATGGS